MRFDIRPVAKARPRLNRNTGTVYTPLNTKTFEARLKEQYLAAGGVKYLGPVGLYLSLHADHICLDVMPLAVGPARPLRGDIDNYTKAVQDALNGVAYEDDKQVRLLVVSL